MIKAVFFDIGGTVHTQDSTLESDKDYTKRLTAFLEANGVRAEIAPEALLEAVNANHKKYKRYIEKELVELPQDEVWQEFILKGIVPEGSLTGLGEDLSYMFDRYRKHIVKRAGLAETLECLKGKGYRLGIVSNIMSSTFVPRILEEHGVLGYFDSLTLSCVCGIRKPRREIFDAALNAAGVSADESAYVGDTVSRDVIGVRNAGWSLMIQIENPRVYEKDRKYMGQGFCPDVKIKELSEIVPALERFNKTIKGGATA